ncbi:hypothetical protein HmCmsJML219_04235 [Escherichia coli]|nr:hypothetical protein HmCmsJML219_04235 [Escherichia coli]
MPVHQLNGLACQCPFYMRHKFVEIQDVLRTGFTEINPPLFAVLQIIKKTLAGQADKFASNNFSCNNTFGVADPVSHFCHQSLAFKSSASGSTLSGPAVFTFARLAGDIPNSASIARIRFQASAFIAAAGCALISTSPFCVSER